MEYLKSLFKTFLLSLILAFLVFPFAIEQRLIVKFYFWLLYSSIEIKLFCLGLYFILLLIFGHNIIDIIKRWKNNIFGLKRTPFIYIDSILWGLFFTISFICVFQKRYLKMYSLEEIFYQAIYVLIAVVISFAIYWLLQFCYEWCKEKFIKIKPNENTGLTYADNAKERIDENVITGREDFVNQLYDQLTHLPFDNSVVFSLTGAWGEGKTTVLNFLSEKLSKNDRYIVIKFNPWEYQGKDSILEGFYQEIKNTINKNYLLPQLGRSLKKYITAIKTGSSHLSLDITFDRSKSKEMIELKNEIGDIINRTEKKVVVLIDDIDRLQGDEIINVFGLVINNSNFQNTRYILSYDHESVVEQLTKGKNNSEKWPKYIDKVVQIPVKLPIIEQKSIGDFLFPGINEIFDKLNIDEKTISKFYEKFNGVYWEEGVKIIKNLRFAKRYLNNIAYTLPALKEEINLYDFFVFKLIELHSPAVIDDIYENRWYYISIPMIDPDMPAAYSAEILPDEHRKDYFKKVCNNNKSIINLLQKIFPQTIDDDSSHFDSRDEDFNHIHSKKYFDKYFLLRTRWDDISDKHMDDIITYWQTPDRINAVYKIEQEILFQSIDKKIGVLLNKIKQRVESLSDKLAVSLIKAVSNSSSLITKAVRNNFPESDFDSALKLIFFVLEIKLKTQGAEKLIQDIILETPDYKFAIKLVLFLSNNKNEFSQLHRLIDCEKEKSRMATRLQNEVINGNHNIFHDYREDCGPILFNWAFHLNDRENANEYLKKSLGDNDLEINLIFFLRSLKNLTSFFNKKDFEGAFDIEMLINFSNKYLSRYIGNDRKLVEEFLSLMQDDVEDIEPEKSENSTEGDES